MPAYDFHCFKCNVIFEVTKKMMDPNPEKCPACSSKKIERYYPGNVPNFAIGNRPIWTYNDAKKYKTCSTGGKNKKKIDPSKHGDLGSQYCE